MNQNLIKRLGLLAMSLFLMAQANAHLPQQSAGKYLYTIHLGAFVDAKMADFQEVRTLGYLYSQQFDSKLSQIYLGEFEREAQARNVLEQVKHNGYPEAYVTRRPLDKGQEVKVIQLAAYPIGEPIDWSEYEFLGSLHTFYENDHIKILNGPFINDPIIDDRLRTLRKMGFSDAFVRTVNSVKMHEVTGFELSDVEVNASFVWEGQSSNRKPQTYDMTGDRIVRAQTAPPAAVRLETPTTSRPIVTPPTAQPLNDVQAPAPSAVAVVARPSAEILAMKSGDMTAKGSTAVAETTADSKPEIRKGVKRNSVLELQKVLKKYGTYTSSLDGLYGPGTTKGYTEVLTRSRQLTKYRMLADQPNETLTARSGNILQHHINTLLDEPAAATRYLNVSREPVAKAYLAYAWYKSQGPSAQVNDLMNTAIKQAFASGQKKAGFDETATYSYQDDRQLLLHMAYVQEAAPAAPQLPCWMFDQHQGLMNTVLTKAPKLELEGCSTFMEWEELKLLRTIARDLDTREGKHLVEDQSLQSLRTRLYVAPMTPTAEEQQQLEQWNNRLWAGLEAWAQRDPLHQKIVNPFQVTYYQSLIMLEDYFMNRGFGAADARALGLGVLSTVVMPQLERYVDGGA